MQNDNFKTYANSFQAIARLRLESIECLLKYLDNPQNDLKFIHVAGTNGKGSVCNFLQSIFTSAGYRTGKYTSPNLISVCERISIDGELITKDDMESLLKTVEQGAQKVVQELGESPTQFEIWTAAAFLYFKAKKCDLVVLETGLGGTRDATNIIPPPLASVITRLDLDHTEHLGDTIEKIAVEKAGIIKTPANGKTGICVTSHQDDDALNVLTEVCRNKRNNLVVATAPKLKGFEDFRESFDYTSANGNVTIEDIECGLCGIYQPENGALAIETALQLGIEEKHIKNGIKYATNPARFEIIRKDPVVIYDGAHNKNGISALCACLKRYFPQWCGGTFVIGFMGDKDMDAAFQELKKSGLMDNSCIFAVQVKDNPRAATAVQICDRAKAHGMEAIPFDTISEAYQKALVLDSPVIVCGSLYLYKDFYEII